jgi:hypothetical protein
MGCITIYLYRSTLLIPECFLRFSSRYFRGAIKIAPLFDRTDPTNPPTEEMREAVSRIQDFPHRALSDIKVIQLAEVAAPTIALCAVGETHLDIPIALVITVAVEANPG